ncbi:hypothetical protein GCM10022199_23320 [Marihabitans asiaticum]|uniref:EcsC family protein n=1 Tax=Marihabitans asiaticum TaxID=415218 RepID=A0A560W9Y6_9MICO|nr:EcsC family protein [Marihabitans asiaticum]TWD14446.1 EcsC family protein [Marihabitans asiaticum]
MNEPSPYEMKAWEEIQAFQGRQLSARMADVGQKVADTGAAIGERTGMFLGDHPRAQKIARRGRDIAAKGSKAVSSGAQAASERLPSWTGTIGASAERATAKVSRAGLSPKRVVARHQKHGHDITRLSDLRALDLEQVDAVKGRSAEWLYPVGAAMTGAAASFAITGSQVTTAASAGAAAAPGAATIVAAMAGDSAAVLGLGSRAVGRAALMYGYDPESPAEKLFILSVVNAGTAVTATAKTAAMKDISKLTQALVRGKTWEILNQSVVARVTGKFATQFADRWTKQTLGKVLPGIGVAIGGTLNWSTLEGIVDTADVAYRRRFLLEKYPDLATGDTFGEDIVDAETVTGDSDVDISIVRELVEVGGPDLDSGAFTEPGYETESPAGRE